MGVFFTPSFNVSFNNNDLCVYRCVRTCSLLHTYGDSFLTAYAVSRMAVNFLSLELRLS